MDNITNSHDLMTAILSMIGTIIVVLGKQKWFDSKHNENIITTALKTLDTVKENTAKIDALKEENDGQNEKIKTLMHSTLIASEYRLNQEIRKTQQAMEQGRYIDSTQEMLIDKLYADYAGLGGNGEMAKKYGHLKDKLKTYIPGGIKNDGSAAARSQGTGNQRPARK